MTRTATTSQTVGPFFRIGLERLYRQDLTVKSPVGKRVEIYGPLLDGDGQPVEDGVLELWQADAHGKHLHPEDSQHQPTDPNFHGFGCCPTDDDGSFRFVTVKPGRVPGPDGKLQAPHIVVSVFMRGLLRRLVTRIYFPGDPANEEDFALQLIHAARRKTLVAERLAGHKSALEWNVLLQ